MTTATTRLTDVDRRIIAQSRELAALGGLDAIRKHAGQDDTAAALASVFGAAQFLLGDLAAIVERLGDTGPDEDDEDEEELAAFCHTCGSPVGHFIGHGDGWHHFRGEGTPDNPNVLFDAGHAPDVAWRPAGGR